MIRASLKCLMLVLWTLFWLGPVWVVWKLGKDDLRKKWCRRFSKGMLWILGVRLHVTGALSERRPLLLVSNHISYLDVPVLASEVSASFTPKSEIAGWPLISTICRMTDAVYVNRRPDKVKQVGEALHAALARGQVVSLFPESTTGGGMHLLPFHSGFFSLAKEPINGQELLVQPAALTFTRIRRLPIDTTQWPKIAWLGDVFLAPHFWELLQLGPIDAELSFLPVTKMSEHGDRKKLASYCQQAITAEIERLKAAAPNYPPGLFCRLRARK